MGREVRCPDEWERLIRAFPTRRDVVKLAGLAGVAALPAWVSSCLKPAPTAPPTRESSPPRTAPIEGYANATSYRVGETASFQVSNNSGDPRIEVEVVRAGAADTRSEEHTSELQSLTNLVCRLLLEKKNIKRKKAT